MNISKMTTAALAAHLLETRTFWTESLFDGSYILAPQGGEGTQLYLERGVLLNVLEETTGRVSLSSPAYQSWVTEFGMAYSHALYNQGE